MLTGEMPVDVSDLDVAVWVVLVTEPPSAVSVGPSLGDVEDVARLLMLVEPPPPFGSDCEEEPRPALSAILVVVVAVGSRVGCTGDKATAEVDIAGILVASAKFGVGLVESRDFRVELESESRLSI